MTAVPQSPVLSPKTLIWDTSPILHAIKAGKLDILGDIAQNCGGVARRNVTTQAVISEIDYFQLPLEGAGWLEVVHVDDLRELEALVTWMALVAGAKSNHGEATVLTWSQIHGARAVVDDRDAQRIGQQNGLDVCGSLRVVAESVSDGHITEYAGSALVDSMIDSGARYPCQRGQFLPWCKQHGLL
ncbi:hypothetical protein [Streptomyces sp. NPDC046887]|uniref:hypothetical protein n=1 Tax=Streptomyces sp. NPDC046887 TaxID=3155472 RepID=UPI0033D66C37